MDIPANIYLLGQRVKSLSLVKMSILEPPSWLHRGYYTVLSACQLSCTSHRGSFVGGVKTRHKSTMGYTLLHPGFSRDKSIVDSAWRFEFSPVGTVHHCGCYQDVPRAADLCGCPCSVTQHLPTHCSEGRALLTQPSHPTGKRAQFLSTPDNRETPKIEDQPTTRL